MKQVKPIINFVIELQAVAGVNYGLPRHRGPFTWYACRDSAHSHQARQQRYVIVRDVGAGGQSPAVQFV